MRSLTSDRLVLHYWFKIFYWTCNFGNCFLRFTFASLDLNTVNVPKESFLPGDFDLGASVSTISLTFAKPSRIVIRLMVDGFMTGPNSGALLTSSGDLGVEFFPTASAFNSTLLTTLMSLPVAAWRMPSPAFGTLSVISQRSLFHLLFSFTRMNCFLFSGFFAPGSGGFSFFEFSAFAAVEPVFM